MSDSKVYYITTPIYYINALPHIGNAYTTIVADTLARHHRARGREVVFATGTDEHAEKVLEAAGREGVPILDFADRLADGFRAAWARLDITYDDFIRTSATPPSGDDRGYPAHDETGDVCRRVGMVLSRAQHSSLMSRRDTHLPQRSAASHWAAQGQPTSSASPPTAIGALALRAPPDFVRPEFGRARSSRSSSQGCATTASRAQATVGECRSRRR